MPGYLLNMNASGLCAHGGSATPLGGSPRVKTSGAPVLTVTTQLAISGCPNVVGTANVPCVLATFAAGAARVKTMGQPVLLADARPTNLPTGASTSIINTQLRVKGI